MFGLIICESLLVVLLDMWEAFKRGKKRRKGDKKGEKGRKEGKGRRGRKKGEIGSKKKSFCQKDFEKIFKLGFQDIWNIIHSCLKE